MSEEVKALNDSEIQERLGSVSGWSQSSENGCLVKNFQMKNFLDAVDFINKIAPLAEEADHHPDLHLTGYKKLKVEIKTHSIGALSKKDFDLAGKIDQLGN